MGSAVFNIKQYPGQYPHLGHNQPQVRRPPNSRASALLVTTPNCVRIPSRRWIPSWPPAQVCRVLLQRAVALRLRYLKGKCCRLPPALTSTLGLGIGLGLRVLS